MPSADINNPFSESKYRTLGFVIVVIRSISLLSKNVLYSSRFTRGGGLEKIYLVTDEFNNA